MLLGVTSVGRMAIGGIPKVVVTGNAIATLNIGAAEDHWHFSSKAAI
jgi:hypothetical protein